MTEVETLIDRLTEEGLLQPAPRWPARVAGAALLLVVGGGLGWMLRSPGATTLPPVDSSAAVGEEVLLWF